MGREIWLIRHGQSAWNVAGLLAGRSDIPLSEEGRRQAATLPSLIAGHRFARVLVSPLERARETCRLAGYLERAEIEPDLAECDYGDHEGRPIAELAAEHPNWCLWSDGAPHGETLAMAAARADRVIARALAAEGDVALFAHAHILRILTARWLGLDACEARRFALGTASMGRLGFERGLRVILRWNLSAWA